MDNAEREGEFRKKAYVCQAVQSLIPEKHVFTWIRMDEICKMSRTVGFGGRGCAEPE